MDIDDAVGVERRLELRQRLFDDVFASVDDGEGQLVAR
jgi:hypothetical protein